MSGAFGEAPSISGADSGAGVDRRIMDANDVSASPITVAMTTTGIAKRNTAYAALTMVPAVGLRCSTNWQSAAPTANTNMPEIAPYPPPMIALATRESQNRLVRYARTALRAGTITGIGNSGQPATTPAQNRQNTSTHQNNPRSVNRYRGGDMAPLSRELLSRLSCAGDYTASGRRQRGFRGAAYCVGTRRNDRPKRPTWDRYAQQARVSRGPARAAQSRISTCRDAASLLR